MQQLTLPTIATSTYNIDLDTNIRYGITTNIDDDFLVYEVMQSGVDLIMKSNYEDWMLEQLEECELEDIDESEFFDNYDSDYAKYEYNENGLHLIASNINGYFEVTVLKSPHVVKCRLCSPCVPNAGDLSSPDENGFETYALPVDAMRE